MSKAATISIIIFILIVGGIFGYIYYKYERNVPDGEDYVDLSIFAIEKETISILEKETISRIETGYVIKVQNLNYSDKKTSSTGAVFDRVPINSSISIFNYNLENQTYYTDFVNFITSENKTYRVNLELIKVGELNVSYVADDEKINVTVLSSGEFRKMYFCFDYSLHILYVNVENKTKKEKNCYYGNDLKDGEEMLIQLKYSTFGTVSEEDFININFFDESEKIQKSINIFKL